MSAVYRRAAGLTHELTLAEGAARAGVDPRLAIEIWRAFGIPEVDARARVFDEQDVDTLRSIKALMDAGITAEDVIAVSRVYGLAFSRIAEVEQRIYRKQFLDPIVRAGATPDPEALEPLSRLILPLLDAPIRNAHRRQLEIAIRHLLVAASEAGTEPYAVGFVDLVEYSRLVATLEGAELTRLMSRFDELAVEACTEAGANVVKLVGDAVMFVSSEADVVLEAARVVVRGAGTDDVLPAARGGLDFGDVLPLEGDYFGTPVNSAARIVAIAKDGTVVVSGAFADALGARAAELQPLGERSLKGVGTIELFEMIG